MINNNHSVVAVGSISPSIPYLGTCIVLWGIKAPRDYNSVSNAATPCGIVSLPAAMPPEPYTGQSGPTSWI